MGTQITPTGIKFDGYDDEQTAPVRSVNSTQPDASGNIEVAAGGGATYTNQNYHATTDFLFKDSKWYGGHVVYSYSTNASAIENLSVGSVLHEVGSDLSFSVVSIDAAANRITLNRGDFVDLGTSNKTLEDRENSTFGSTTFTYVSGAGNSINCTNIWLQVKGNENHANTTTLPTTNNSVANLPMKLDHLPSMATHIIFRVSSETGGSFKIYNRETFNTRPADAELLPSEIVHQIDVEGSGTQSGFSEFRVPVNSYFRFWVTGGAKANLYPVGYSVLDLSEIDLESASNPVITALETRVNTLEGSSGVTSVNGQTGDVTVSGFDGDYNSLSGTPPEGDFFYSKKYSKSFILQRHLGNETSREIFSLGHTGGGSYTSVSTIYAKIRIFHNNQFNLVNFEEWILIGIVDLGALYADQDFGVNYTQTQSIAALRSTSGDGVSPSSTTSTSFTLNFNVIPTLGGTDQIPNSSNPYPKITAELTNHTNTRISTSFSVEIGFGNVNDLGKWNFSWKI